MLWKDKILEGLNEQQREAVLNIDTPTLVIAGAGSGKTTTLVHKMAYLTAEGVRPERIVALTFTRQAANEMKERARRLVPYDLPWVKTFHAFSLKLLRNYSRYLKYINIPENFKVADDSTTMLIVREILDEMAWDADVSEVRGFIAYVKRSGNLEYYSVIKEFYESDKGRIKRMLIGKKGKDKNSIEELEEMLEKGDVLYKLIQVFNEYNERLRLDNMLDFEDLQIYAVKLLQEVPIVHRAVQNRFDHILIDEYQDTDAVQYKLFELIAGDKGNPKIFTTVGDPNQAIYTWRNARVENILHLDKVFASVKVVKLEQNYRSAKRILILANKIAKEIAKDWPDKIVQLKTNKPLGEPVVIESFEDADEEAKWIVERIQKLNAEGVKLSDIAVLMRTNYLSENIERALSYEGIPYTFKGSKRFYDREEIDVLIAYLRFALDPTDGVSFKKSVRFPSRRVGMVTLQNIENHYETDWLQAVEKYLEHNTHAGLSEYVRNIKDFQSRLKQYPLHKAFRMLIEDIGLYDYLQDRYIATAEDRISAIEKLLATLEKYNFTPEGFLALVDRMKSSEGDNEKNAVVLSTIHAAKGLEWDTVFVISLNEGFLPHKRAIESYMMGDPTPLKEEMRVFYVAITRPKNRLFLTYLEHMKRSRYLDILLED